jgi:cysteine desulfurase/selenocysteine lyase
VSFYHNDIHAHDLAQIMGDANVAVRAGHHCAQPLLRHLGVSSTLRISISIYNTEADIQAALSAIENAEEIFA